MVSDSGYSLSDIKAVTDNNDNMFGGNCGWFIWLFLIFGMFRGYGGYGYDGVGGQNLISEEFIKRDIFNTNHNVSTTACNTQKEIIENRYTTQLGLQQLQAAQAQCCCETQKEILESRYDNALAMNNLQAQLAACCCDLKSAIKAEGEATRGLIQANTIQDLRDRLADRDRELMGANYQISQVAQTSRIIDTVRPFPTPAYITCSPYTAFNGFGCSFNSCGTC